MSEKLRDDVANAFGFHYEEQPEATDEAIHRVLTDPEVVERVARALAEHQYDEFDDPWPKLRTVEHEGYRDDARRILTGEDK